MEGRDSAPLRERLDLVHCLRFGRNKHADVCSADFIAMAVRAMEDRFAPTLCEPWNVGQPIHHPMGKDYSPGVVAVTGCAVDSEAHLERAGGINGLIGRPLHSVVGEELPTSQLKDLDRGHPVPAQAPVRLCSTLVTRLTVVNDQHRAASPGQLQGCGHARIATADHHCVEGRQVL